MRKADRFLGAFSLCVLSLLIFPASLHAIDLTLHVPVELPYMPANILQGKIICDAYLADRVTGAKDPSKSLGRNETIFPIKGGFNSFVDVVIKSAATNPPTGIGWTCTLWLLDTTYKNFRGVVTPTFFPAKDLMEKYYVDLSRPVKYTTEGIR